MGIVARLNTTSSIGRATIKSTKATIVAPDYKPKPNVALVELTDVSAGTVQDGYVIQYNSETSKYEPAPLSNAAISLTNVYGGQF